jgi:hypothetical protein
MTLEECLDQLKANGLKTIIEDPEWAVIWATEIQGPEGRVSTWDRSCLVVDHDNPRWVFVLWALTGALEYAVPGTLEELTPLILRVYANHRECGGTFVHAFQRAVPDNLQYLGDELYVGRHKFKDGIAEARARQAKKECSRARKGAKSGDE